MTGDLAREIRLQRHEKILFPEKFFKNSPFSSSCSSISENFRPVHSHSLAKFNKLSTTILCPFKPLSYSSARSLFRIVPNKFVDRRLSVSHFASTIDGQPCEEDKSRHDSSSQAGNPSSPFPSILPSLSISSRPLPLESRHGENPLYSWKTTPPSIRYPFALILTSPTNPSTRTRSTQCARR